MSIKLPRLLVVGCLLAAQLPIDARAIDLDTADGLVDFDSAVGFITPRTISVFRSSEPNDHLYFIMPNSVQLSQRPDGSADFSLLYEKQWAPEHGYISFSVEPVIDAKDVSDAIAEIKKIDAQARFGLPQPTSSLFYIVGPEMGTKELSQDKQAGNPLRTKSSFSTEISRIAVRASLQPASYKYSIFTVGHNFSLRGTSRDQQGDIKIIERRISTSFVINGICALAPEHVVDLTNGRKGCLSQHHPWSLVVKIQQLLAQRGFAPGPFDGIMGPYTEFAIRQFQTKRGIIVDGIPTPELLEMLQAN